MFMQMKSSVKRKRGLAVAGLMLVVSTLSFTGVVAAAPKGPQTAGVLAQSTAVPTPPPTPARPITQDDQRIITGDQVVSGNNYTLRSNEDLRGDLTVFGGSAVLEEGSRVDGNVTVFGGESDISGAVTGNINMIGGLLHLRAPARVDGSLHMVGGTVDRDPAAVVRGQMSRITPPIVNRVTVRPDNPFSFFVNLVGAAFAKVGMLILITLLAIAVVSVFPGHITLTAGVAKTHWLVAGSIGILTFVVMPFVIFILAITICLLPAAIVIALGWIVAILLGWVVSARVVGEIIASQLHLRSWSTLGYTVMGVVILALLGMLPFLGWIVGLVASSVGLGALILSRGGTRAYPVDTASPSLPTPVSLS